MSSTLSEPSDRISMTGIALLMALPLMPMAIHPLAPPIILTPHSVWMIPAMELGLLADLLSNRIASIADHRVMRHHRLAVIKIGARGAEASPAERASKILVVYVL